MHRNIAPLLFTLIAFLSACQSAKLPEETVAPASDSTPTAAPATPIPIAATDTSLPPMETATSEPSAEPPATATNTVVTSLPTETPVPSAAVDTINLSPLIAGAFDRPVYLTHAFDERLFVVEQAGVIRIIKDGQLLDEPFLDIRDRVGSSQLEQGLLSIAFHHDYQQNGRFFTYYTDKGGTVHISAFEVGLSNPDQADPGSEIILLTLAQPYPNHNGGQLEFGPDGYLYAGFGDGGSANDPLGSGQDPSTLLGSIVRLDVDQSPDAYAVPESNPFISVDDRRNEIWAWGLRNPWRFSFDRLTGDLFVADVGQNTWEELNFQPAASSGGENYGWNITEGNHCFQAESCDQTGLVQPVFDYSHQDGCSVTGGYMYRGTLFPSLYGNYFLADFCSGIFWRLFPNNDGSWSSAKVLDSELVISSFGEDVNGELYVLVHDEGSIYQIQP